MRIFRIVFAVLTSLYLGFASQPSGAVTLKTLTCTPPAADPEIVALARALNYDQQLIFEYVYYNVEFSQTYGSKKGPLATFLDGRGNNFDQNVLFVTLLRQSCISARYHVGTVTKPRTQIANLYGVENTRSVLSDVLSNGNIPNSIPVSGTTLDLTMVWTEIVDTGALYDPSYKSHTQYTPIDVGAAMGYSQSGFMTDALLGSAAISGMPAGVNSLKTVNRANITKTLNRYADNLANYIKTNAASSSAKQLFGGREITSTNFQQFDPGSATSTTYDDLPTNLYDTEYIVTVSNNADGSSPGLVSGSLWGSQITGKRLILTYDASNHPVLALEGQTIVTGTATGASTQTVSLTVNHKSYPAGSTTTVRPTIKVGGTYAIMLVAGEVGRDTSARHLRLMGKLKLAGNGDLSEPVLGENLAAIGATYLSQASRARELMGSMGGSVIVFHNHLGIAGYNGQATYVDFPGQTSSVSEATSTSTEAARLAQFAALAMYKSTLESTSVTQTQKSSAASTVLMFNYANDDGTGFIQATSTNWTSVRPLLTGWASGELDAMGAFLTSASDRQVVLPQNGSRTVGTWTGSGYYRMYLGATAGANFGYLISGGYKGAFGTGYDYENGEIDIWGVGTVHADIVAGAIETDPYWDSSKMGLYEIFRGMQVCITGCGAQYDWIEPTFQLPTAPPASNEPINLLSGAYTYDHQDISIGSGAFPLSLSFQRSYDSSRATAQTPMGYGWQHNFMTSAATGSDSEEAFGDRNPLTATATVVAAYVMSDLMSDRSTSPVPPLTKTVTSSLTASWLMDQLRDNAITLTLSAGSRKFIKIPTLDGAGYFVAPPGDGSTAVINPDGSIIITDKSQTKMTFVNGGIASWRDSNGNTVTFTYGTNGFSAQLLLKSVASSLGRSLNFTYNSSNQLTAVGDGTRTVSYTYDSAGNLRTFVDSAPTPATTTFAYGQTGQLTQIFYPSFPTTPFMTNVYDDFDRVKTQADANGNVWTYLFANGRRSQEIDPTGASHTLYYDSNGNQTVDIDQLNNRRTMAYDGQGRLVLTTAPEGNTIANVYSADLKHNIIQVTQTPKPGSPLAPLVTTSTYDALFNKPTTVTDPRGLVTRMTYDPWTGNLLSVVADAGSAPHFNAKMTFTYNGYGQILTSTDPMGTVMLNGYDIFGNNTSTIRDYGAGRLNQIVVGTYNSLGDATSTTDANGNTTLFAYDTARRVTAVTSPLAPPATPNGLVTTFSYDPDGRVVGQQQSANGVALISTATTYALTGKPATATDANGNVTAFAYDVVNRPSSVTDAVGRVTSYAYDAAGQRTKVFNTAIQAAPLLQQTYTPNGGTASLTEANNNTTNYAYDGLDRLATTTYPGGSTETLTYDADGNVLTRKTRANQTITFTYDTLNRLTSKTPPSPAPVVSYSYDLAGRPTGVSDTSVAMNPALPPSGTSAQYATNISYDSLNRPTGVNWDPAPAVTLPAAGMSVTFTHTYNKVNQRIGQTVTDNAWWSYPTGPPSTVNYTANALNQYTVVGAVAPSYDGNGNLTSDSTFSFGYDAENRLVSASGAGNTVSYSYDAQGRRKSKTVNGAATVFITDADNREVLEYNGASGQLQRWYAYGLGPNSVHGQMNVPGNNRLTFLRDQLGSIIGILDSTGTLTKVGYGPYGKSAATTAFAYTGQRIDPETSGLYHYRTRIYSPLLGRFLQTDPIGTQGGINLYAYVGNDPFNAVDPFGLAKDPSPGATPTPDTPEDTPIILAADVTRQLERQGILGPGGRVLGDGGGGGGTGSGGGGGNGGLAAPPVGTAPAAPNFVVTPGGTAFPVPRGATGPVPSINPGGKQTGVGFVGGSGGKNGQVDNMRIMDPTPPRGRSPGYPEGYIKYENKTGQGVDPYTGKTLPNSESHYPIDR